MGDNRTPKYDRVRNINLRIHYAFTYMEHANTYAPRHLGRGGSMPLDVSPSAESGVMLIV